MFTGLPSDVITNNWCFVSDGVVSDETAATYLTDRLQSFYQAAYGTTRMAAYMVPASAEVDWYNLGDPTPRVPFATLPIVPATATGVSVVPTEASIVLSFHGLFVSGSPNARRRGRVYLGGLATAALAAGTNAAYPAVGPATITAIIGGAEDYLLDTDDAGLLWAVYSPTDNLAYPIVGGWVDNGVDTQRRRSVLATARTIYP